MNEYAAGGLFRNQYRNGQRKARIIYIFLDENGEKRI
jgi:hypothetical protein